MFKRLAAEFLGTFWLVLCGCGSAVLAATFPKTGIGYLGVAFAFGLTLVTMIYAVGYVSGGHFNPAVTFGLWSARRFRGRDVGPYMVVQVIGAIAAAAVLFVIASGTAGFSASNGFAANGYGAHSPGGYNLTSALVAEFVLSLFFIFIIIGVTDDRAHKKFAPLAIGLALTLIHLVLIPVTNASVNPARSIGPAIFQGSWALSQLWLFIVAPLAGGAVGGLLYQLIMAKPKTDTENASPEY